METFSRTVLLLSSEYASPCFVPSVASLGTPTASIQGRCRDQPEKGVDEFPFLIHRVMADPPRAVRSRGELS
eukprot:13423159-Alexandrium_andersonii.AAC.1